MFVMQRKYCCNLFPLVLIILMVACSAKPSTPTPTSTSIPGFVAGEEQEAYSSFMIFYEEEVVDCYWTAYMEGNLDYFLAKDKQGKAIYVGDGIWRFYVTVGVIDLLSNDIQPHYKEITVERRSLSNRTWEDECTREWQYHDDDWPDPSSLEEFDEPPEETDYYP